MFFKMENPLESLLLEYINNLTVLEIGENRIRSWNRTIFDKVSKHVEFYSHMTYFFLWQNGKLEEFKMASNGLDIILTDQMVFDFFNNTRLRVLDLSDNSFICSPAVPQFVLRASIFSKKN